jgi:hypothetical protein
MKHPFHTLFYIGFLTMLFVGTFLTLLVINIKDILPSTLGKSELRVVNQDPIVAIPIEILSGPTPQIKPIEKVIPKETPKPILVSEPIVLKPVTEDTVVKEVKTIDSSKTP